MEIGTICLTQIIYSAKYLLDALKMKSFKIYGTDWTSRKQIAHLIVLLILGIGVLFTALALSPRSRTLKFKFSHSVVSRPTPGGQGIHYRNRNPSDGPEVFPRTYDAWIRVADLICNVTIEVERP